MVHTTRILGGLPRTQYDSYKHGESEHNIDTNKANITKVILEAAELSIPKSSGEHQQHHTGRTTWELGWQSRVTIPN